jgi:hypothetical protein
MVCSDGIPAVPWKRKQIGIPFRGTNIEANFRNFVPKHFKEENTLSILFDVIGNFRSESLLKTRQPKIPKTVSEKTTFEVRKNHLV